MMQMLLNGKLAKFAVKTIKRKVIMIKYFNFLILFKWFSNVYHIITKLFCTEIMSD